MSVEKPVFYICKLCGNLVGFIHSSGAPLVCCGEEMTQLKPNTVDASREKHVPVIKTEGSLVTVDIGSVPHPMTPEHHIAWVYVLTRKGGQRKTLAPGEKPSVTFALTGDDKLLAAYAYCNLHGLWLAETNG